MGKYYRDLSGLASIGNTTKGHEEAMHHLSPAAVWLHTPLGAGIGLSLTAITTLIAFAFSGSAPLYFIPAIAFAIIDWHNFSTWHGRINWKPFHYERGRAFYWTCIIGPGLFAFVPAAIYGIQSLQVAGQVKEIQRVKVQEHIEQLEAELGRSTPQLPSRE